MKKEATTPQASDEWRAARRVFDRELQRRGAAERTRRAYGVDLGQLALWGTANGIEPGAVDASVLRRYAAQLAARGAGPGSVARKLAAIRSFFTSMVELGEMTTNPADLLPAPELPRRLPATTPLELRDRAMFELAHGCGLGAEELVGLELESIDFASERALVQRKGGKTRFIAVGEPALRSVARYLERGRPGLAGAEGCSALLLSKSGLRLSSSDVRRRLRFATLLLEGGGSTTPVYTRIESARLRAAYTSSHPRA